MRTRIFKSISAVITAVTLSLVSSLASASLMTLEFNNGDLLTDWKRDRTMPSGFEIINNELVMTVNGPLNANSFYNTHGMQLDIGQSNYMSVDMWIDDAWTASGRYGGMWGVAYDNTATRVDEYPILEYQNNYQGDTGVAKWESGVGWVVPPTSLYVENAFNKLEIMLTNNEYKYFVNGNLVHEAAAMGNYLGTVILNGYNTMSAEQGYQVRYDNLTFGTVDVPEPQTLVLLLLALAFISRRQLTNK